MKKLILYPLMMMFLMSLVLGIGVPHPINGHITADGNAVGNAVLIVENLNSKITSEATTNSNGFYQVELANVDPTFRDGDIIKVSVSYCKDIPICTKSVAISGGGNEISWDIIIEELPIPPIEIIIYKYVCWDGSKSDTADNCPVIPAPVYVCGDGSEVDDSSKCPEEKDDSLVAILAGLAAGLLIGGAGGYYFKRKEAMSKGVGIKIYTKRDGTESVLHKHPGIVGYHEPMTSHRDKIERHPKGELTPKYEKNLEGVWVYVG